MKSDTFDAGREEALFCAEVNADRELAQAEFCGSRTVICQP